MSPSAETSSLTSRKSARRAVGLVARGHRRPVALIAVTAFLGGLIEALFLVMITRAAFAITHGDDRIEVVSNHHLSMRSALLLAVALLCIRVVLAGFACWLSAKLATGVVAGLRRRLGRAFLDSSWEVQQAQRAGSLQELLTTFSGQAGVLMVNMTQGVVMGANLVAMFGVAVAVHPVAALGLVFSVTVLALTLRPLRSLVRRRARASTDVGMEFAISVNEVSELGFELHIFHAHSKAADRLNDAIERVRKAVARLQFANGVSTPLYSGLAYLAILGALAAVDAANTANLPSLGATMLVMLRSLSYGQGAQSAYLGVSGTVPAIEELQHRLQIFDTGRRVPGAQLVGSIGTITMDRVSFAYAKSEPVLRDISFTIMPGEIVGIVGPSGAGKSTLVQLLLGLREPGEGRVLADGRDISSLDRAAWARKVTFVPQTPRLIASTISENIRFLRDNVSQEDVERAARLAHLHDDVVGFPEGYERQVGKHGGHLSGGQQQRLCIARALVEHPDLLILDEPTSSLDVRSEHLIRSTLLGLKERTTVIVIAHRLSTLTICDRIMVIKDGELKDFDTPLNLERSSEFYRESLALSRIP